MPELPHATVNSLIALAKDEWPRALGMCGLQIIIGIGTLGGSWFRRFKEGDTPRAATALLFMHDATIVGSAALLLPLVLPREPFLAFIAWVALVALFGVIGGVVGSLFPENLAGAALQVTSPFLLASLGQWATAEAGEHYFWAEIIYTGVLFITLIPVVLMTAFVLVGPRYSDDRFIWYANVLITVGLLYLTYAGLFQMAPLLLGGTPSSAPLAWACFLASLGAFYFQALAGWWVTQKAADPVSSGVLKV